ncbi:uncharacterized protein LOC117411141 isoform X2 [Acipenser ruthenus]|uniref:uncharacterized protein LOC117411141 isoform X2 n=1 Tax=Acipenser ruthenus TaxID=7906 RepID=UPI00274091DD|nr:uncharacterized protein LOC117411141 isoform X2 [Acipenser ruthenus]
MDHFEASSDLDTSDELTEEGCEITFERVVLNGDLEEDGDCQERPGSLLWEKSFEQSIFVDIEDDGSFHFSDLQDSYTFQLSQDSAEDTSLNLIGQHMEELDSYGNIQDKTTSESSFESHKVHGTKSSITRISEQRHNTMEDLPLHTPYLLVDTSDEEQEDLPYDDNFDSNNKAITTDSNMDDYRIPLAISNNILTGHLSNIRDAGKPNKNTYGEFSFPVCVSSCETENNENEIDTISEVTKVPVKNDHQLSTFSPELNCFEGSQSGIPEVLLRHFSEENLFSSSKYIEAETMPETSFTESVETETVLNRFKSRHNSPKYNEGKSLLGKDLCKVIELETEPKEQREDDTSKNSECQKTEEISSAESSNTETQDEVSDQLNGPDSPEIIDNEGNQSQRSLFGRAGYCNDIKYGQGQVHYPLPDFSKVAPKIKIPKGSSATNLNNPTPGIKRTESSPGLFSNSTTSLKSAVDVVKEVLDTIQPHETPFDFRDQQKRQYNPKQNPELVQHLQDEYDKLLTKYAEAENLIDQMRLGAKIPLLSDSPKPIENIDSGVMPPHANTTTFRVANPTTAQLGSTPRSPLTGSATDMQDTEVPNNNDTDTTHREPTEGEKMTQALKEMINQFTAKVDEFKSCLNSGTLTVEEQQEIFKSMMDAQDKLERGYMAQKDGHRALELRNDMGKTENIGEFDPERQVEGEIFKIGMCLEDLKEQIDENVCNQPSPPAFTTSTPLPSAVPISSSHTPLHERPGLYQSSEEPRMLEREVRSVSEDNDPILWTAHLNTEQVHSQRYFCESSDMSQESLDVTLCEDGSCNPSAATVKAKDIVYNGISTEPRHTLESRLQTPELQPLICLSETLSCSAALEGLPHSSCNLSVKLHGSSFQQPDSLEQRILTPETDSGFGGSVACRPPTAVFQTHSDQTATEREVSHCRSMFPLLTKMTRSCSSSSDVSSSCIEMDDTRPTDSKGLNDALGFADLSGGSTVGHWTHSIVSDSNPTGEQGSIAQLSGHLIGESSDDHLLLPTPWHCGPPVPTLGNVTSTVDKDSHPCALQNEAILALQSEVSRLRKELEKSLSGLPQRSNRMDITNSSHKQEKTYRARSQSHNRVASYSGRKHMQYRNKKVFTVNRDSSPQKVDDWISSDMEPSTDSEGSSHSFSPSVSHPLHYKADRKSHRRPSRSEEREDSCLVKHQSTDEDYTFSSPRQKHSNALINSQSYSLCNSESNHSSSEDLKSVSKEKNVHQYRRNSNKTESHGNSGSICSLPLSYMVQQSLVPHNRRGSTQSDSALLTSRIYPRRSTAINDLNARSLQSSLYMDAHLNKTLDSAIEAAQSLKRTTDRMAKTLSADFAKAESYRKMHGL